MLEELRPHDLHASARALGVHPFEVVRMLVLSNASAARLETTDATLDALRTFGQIETWWSGTDGLPEDANPRRRVVRGMLDALVNNEHIGSNTTRLDNLWRGMQPDDQDVAEQATMVLLELDYLTSLAAPSGMRVSVNPAALDAVKEVVARGNAPDDLAALWME